MRVWRWIGHAAAVVLLTLVTQLGGLAWLLAVLLRRWWVFPPAYAMLWGLAFVAAPLMGRQALPCFGEPLRSGSLFYCAALRNYVTPELAAVAQDAATTVAQAYPGTVTLTLDASFPFGEIPLLPHLSHDDGEKLDFAFSYRDETGYRPGAKRSPVGYFAFETLDTQTCPKATLTLRWDMRWLQSILRPLALDEPRTRRLIATLTADPRIGKVFVEPPLAQQLGVAGTRFQGCRAARHADHIHVQLR